jgi:hypothetical protein
MKRLPTILLALMSALTLGVIVASAASAVEPGPSPLLEHSFAPTGLPFTSSSGKAVLTTAAGKQIECTAGTDKGTFGGKEGETERIILGTVNIVLTGCKNESVGCRSEAAGKKDPAETVLVGLPEAGKEADIHFVALLEVRN